LLYKKRFSSDTTFIPFLAEGSLFSLPFCHLHLPSHCSSQRPRLIHCCAWAVPHGGQTASYIPAAKADGGGEMELADSSVWLFERTVPPTAQALSSLQLVPCPSPLACGTALTEEMPEQAPGSSQVRKGLPAHPAALASHLQIASCLEHVRSILCVCVSIYV